MFTHGLVVINNTNISVRIPIIVAITAITLTILYTMSENSCACEKSKLLYSIPTFIFWYFSIEFGRKISYNVIVEKIDINDKNLSELKTSVDYITKKGYEFKKLDSLLSEKSN